MNSTLLLLSNLFDANLKSVVWQHAGE